MLARPIKEFLSADTTSHEGTLFISIASNLSYVPIETFIIPTVYKQNTHHHHL